MVSPLGEAYNDAGVSPKAATKTVPIIWDLSNEEKMAAPDVPTLEDKKVRRRHDYISVDSVLLTLNNSLKA